MARVNASIREALAGRRVAARSPIQTSGSTSSGTSRTTRDLAVPVDPEAAKAELLKQRANLQSTRNQITDLYNTVGTVYTSLINAGRNAEARELKNKAQQFARAGSATGISADQRVAALGELKNSMRVAGQLAEGKIQAQQINQSMQILDSLTGLDQNALVLALNDARREVGQSTVRTGAETRYQSARPAAQPRSPLSASISAPRSPLAIRSIDTSRADSAIQDFRNKSALDKFTYERDMYGRGGVNPATQAGFAMAQHDMGYQPGMFKSGNMAAVSKRSPISFTATQPGFRAYRDPTGQTRVRRIGSSPVTETGSK